MWTSRHLKLTLCLGAALALIACADSTPSSGSVPAPTSDCDQRRERAQALITEAPAACASDADCACYPAFVNCGGVTDRERASAITSLKTDGRDCGYENLEGQSFNCAPRRCTPRCHEGTCGRASGE